jgi:HTH-type transcriptional regulator/antitoxin MqsA
MSVTELIDRARLRRSLPDPRTRRAIRLAAGVSLAEVAEVVGVAARTIARWESGQSSPRGEYLGRYVDLLEQLRSIA